MAERPLTLKQEKFVTAYLGEAKGNATEAARIAGYRKPHPEGSRLLRNATIAARVAEDVEKRTVTAQQVLDELADVAMADWRDFITVRTHPKTGAHIDVKMDLTSKIKALELLGKYHQLFIEKQQIDVNIREHYRGVPQSTIDRLVQPAATPTDPKELHA